LCREPDLNTHEAALEA
jgi:hypothetical protein